MEWRDDDDYPAKPPPGSMPYRSQWPAIAALAVIIIGAVLVVWLFA